MKKTSTYTHLLLVLGGLVGSLFVLTGCETTAGAGRDMEAAGEAVEDTAEDTQGY
ncbi:MAG: entericidin A/B family lipoprotein [Opitutales bacterium]